MSSSSQPVPDGPAPGAEWLRRYEDLQRRVTRFSAVEQGLINTRDLLDRELERFNRMHSFNTRAIRAHASGTFPGILAEAIVDVFELEFGCVWLLDAPGGLHSLPAGTTGLQVGETALRAFNGWLGRQFAGGGAEPRLLSGTDLDGLREHVPASQLVVARCRDSAGRCLGWVVGGITDERAEFHSPVRSEHLGSFRVFTQQTAALIQNRRDRSIIQRQVRSIQLSEERLSLALEASKAGLWDWDITAGRSFYSRQWLAILGHAPGEVSSAPEEWSGRLHPEDRERVLAALEAHVTGETDHYEQCFRMRHRDGHYVWIQSRGRALRKAGEGPHRMVGTHLDISAQKEMERRLREAEEAQRQAREQAESASRAKSVFLANMSHEIRTPLNGVSMALELLRKASLGPGQEQLVNAAEQSSRTLLRLLGDILDLSKIEAGRLELEEFTFDLPASIREIVDSFELLARDKELGLALILDPDLPTWVSGDPTRLGQVLSNLIGNAIKFTSKGRIQVAVGVRTQAPGECRVVFGVEDTGIGMSEEVQEGLFTPFMQADSSTTRRFGGTGLGLAISRLLVEMMGGSIAVESRPGQGTAFRFEVPLRVPSDPVEASLPAAPNAAPTAMPAHAGRVLVAEDDRVSRELAVLVVEGMGLEAASATNGQEAVRSFEQEDFDVILMDCNMPEMDGYEATRAIRAIEAARGTPAGARVKIIALTANVLVGERERCLQAGMDDYLTKPLVPPRLSAILSGFSRAASAARPETPPARAANPTRRLGELCQELDAELVRQLASDFLQELPGRLAELKSFHEARQLVELERAAHSLKGVGLSLGLDAFAAVARTVEECAEQCREAESSSASEAAASPDLDEALSAVPGAVDQVVKDVQEWLSRQEQAGTG
ncbi:MAG: response regulator [Verrucomicrobiales bacterium]|nr:response regulator [Verrucomicrobiales bacterium]